MPKYPCTVCGEGFPAEEALMAHVEAVYLDRKTSAGKPEEKQNAK